MFSKVRWCDGLRGLGPRWESSFGFVQLRRQYVVAYSILYISMEFAVSLQFPGTKTLPNPFLASYPHLSPELPSVAVQDVQWNSIFGDIVRSVPRWAFLDSLNAFVTSHSDAVGQTYKNIWKWCLDVPQHIFQYENLYICNMKIKNISIYIYDDVNASTYRWMDG